ncbi:MAG TPA: hypothetical protein DEF82_02815 [Crocinitomicaceae bacterium]|nr:hypothetical protein [Crocinitomicaceae bacterium]
MLTIVTVAFVAVIVVGLLRILKLTNRVNNLEMRLDREVEHVYHRIENEHTEVWRQFENAGRDVTMVEKTIMNQIDKTRKEMDQAIDQLNRIDGELNENARRYTDSRIDKLIDTYFDMVGSKKIIKG